MITARTATAALLLTLGAPIAASANPGPWTRPDWRGACPDTREALISQVCSAVERDPRTCRILRADCRDTYTGARSSRVGTGWQVDHGLPASVAWYRGTWRQPDGSLCARANSCLSFAQFFNDASNLYVTTATANRRKSDLMPDRWCPASRGARMLMAKRFQQTATAYSIPLTPAEIAGLMAWSRGECR